MREIKFRCSAIGRLMTEPKLKSEVLSVGAKTYIRELVAQDIFGVEFEISGREMQKGIDCEQQSIDLLNRVRGLDLVKNTERRADDFLTGECDLFNAPRKRGHDLKTSWSLSTFPIALIDCANKVYEFQMRGYMRLWDADEWSVDYCMVNTPENLIGHEPQAMHFVDHIPEHMRVTSWVVKRDLEIEAVMVEKIKHARRYYAELVAEFDLTHSLGGVALVPRSDVQAPATQRAALPELASLAF
jgi:hypothetical protein